MYYSQVDVMEGFPSWPRATSETSDLIIFFLLLFGLLITNVLCVVACHQVDPTKIHLYKHNYDEEEWNHTPFAQREEEIPRTVEQPATDNKNKKPKTGETKAEVPYYKKFMKDA